MIIMVSINSSFDVPAIEQCLPRLLLAVGLAFCSSTYAATPDTQVDVSYMFDDNVARTKQGGTRLVDRSYSVNLSRPIIFPITDHARTLLTGSMGGGDIRSQQGIEPLNRSRSRRASISQFGRIWHACFCSVRKSFCGAVSVWSARRLQVFVRYFDATDGNRSHPAFWGCGP